MLSLRQNLDTESRYWTIKRGKQKKIIVAKERNGVRSGILKLNESEFPPFSQVLILVDKEQQNIHEFLF